METPEDIYLRSESFEKKNVVISLEEKHVNGSVVIEINSGTNIYSVYADKDHFQRNYTALMNFIVGINYEESVEGINQTIHSFLNKGWRVRSIKP